MSSKNRKKKIDYRNRNTNRPRHRSNRTKENRANESHAAKQLRPTVDEQGDLLKLPDPPPGITYLWVTKEILGEPSDSYDGRMREGYVPISRASMPDSFLLHSGLGGGRDDQITIRGMVACQISTDQFLVNEKVWEDKAKRETASTNRQVVGEMGADTVYLKPDGRLGHGIPDHFM